MFMNRLFAAFVLLGLVSPACAARTARFDEVAYDRAVTLKVDTLELMELATEPYADHSANVRSLRRELRKAQEYARGRPNNEFTTKQWDKLLDPDSALVGGFFRRWQEDGTLGGAFVDGMVKQVGQAFDAIIGLESGKIRASDEGS